MTLSEFLQHTLDQLQAEKAKLNQVRLGPICCAALEVSWQRCANDPHLTNLTEHMNRALAKRDSAKECRERDIKAGMVKVYTERLRGLEGERSMLKSLTDWSARLNAMGVQ